MKLNFEDDTVFSMKISHSLLLTVHAMPPQLPKPNQWSTILTEKLERRTVLVLDNQDSLNTASKLYRQFAHRSQEKLLELIWNAVELWCYNKKAPSRSIAGLSMTTQFQEMVNGSEIISKGNTYVTLSFTANDHLHLHS